MIQRLARKLLCVPAQVSRASFSTADKKPLEPKPTPEAPPKEEPQAKRSAEEGEEEDIPLESEIFTIQRRTATQWVGGFIDSFSGAASRSSHTTSTLHTRTTEKYRWLRFLALFQFSEMPQPLSLRASTISQRYSFFHSVYYSTSLSQAASRYSSSRFPSQNTRPEFDWHSAQN